MSHLNHSTAVFLINDRVRAIRATYDLGADGKPSTNQAHSKVFKTFDPTIKVGDYVIVPTTTRLGFTTNLVTEVDVEPDLNTSAKMDWIVTRFEKSEYDAILVQENDAINAIKKAERAHEREELRKKLLGNVSEEALKALPISTHIDPADTSLPPLKSNAPGA